MKLWLDDERPAPPGWFRVKSAWSAIAWIRTGEVKECSLDHYLGHERNGTGLNVLEWIKNQIEFRELRPFEITIHTDCPVAAKQMNQVICSIIILWNKRRPAHA